MSSGRASGNSLQSFLDPETIVEFTATGVYEFKLKLIYDNEVGGEGSVQDVVTIEVLAADAPPARPLPGVDAGPDVTLIEGQDFAE